jgi:hypothetical protein
VVRGPCFAVDREPAHARASGMGVRRPAKTRERGDLCHGSTMMLGARIETILDSQHQRARCLRVDGPWVVQSRVGPVDRAPAGVARNRWVAMAPDSPAQVGERLGSDPIDPAVVRLPRR